MNRGDCGPSFAIRDVMAIMTSYGRILGDVEKKKRGFELENIQKNPRRTDLLLNLYNNGEAKYWLGLRLL